MAQPTPYDRQFSFQDFQAQEPTTPLPGDEVDGELNSVKVTLDQTLVNLAKIQRDDGALKNGIVTQDSLSSSLSVGFTMRGEWAAPVNYLAGDGVTLDQNKFYRALTSHLSVAGQTPDIRSDLWEQVADFTAATADAQESADAAAASASAAASSASGASGSASTAASAASAASASASAAAGSESSAAASAATAAALIGGTVTQAVRWDTPQGLTEPQQEQARANIGVAEAIVATGWVSAKYFGAVGDFSTDDAAAINEALAEAAATNSRVVRLTTGTYKIGSAIQMQPGVTLSGDGGATIKQADGANLTTLIEFGSAHGAVLEGCIIDGNRANNTDSFSNFLIHLRSANDAVVRNNVINNTPGYCIASNALRPTIEENEFNNRYLLAVFLYNAGEDVQARIVGNRLNGGGLGGIFLHAAYNSLIDGNIISGKLVGARNTMYVDTSGTTITWVSGTKFTDCKPGDWFVLNSGAEFNVTAVTDAEHVTVSTTLPTLSNTPTMFGMGDGVGIGGSQYCRVTNNTINGCVSYGAGTSVGGEAFSVGYTIFANNTIENTGKNGISVAWDSGAGIVVGTSILGNKFINTACGSGIGPLDDSAILVAGQTPGKVYQTFIDGNSVHSAAGTGQTNYWLATDGLGSYGSIVIGKNSAEDCVHGDEVENDVVSVALDAGWGTTAAVTNIVSTGHTVRLTITSSGASQAFGPGFTVFKMVEAAWSSYPKCALLSAAGSLDLRYPFWGEGLTTPGQWYAAYTTTPPSDGIFVLQMK